MHYVYILDSAQISRTYVGHTNDVQRRLREHSQLLARRLARYIAARGWDSVSAMMRFLLQLGHGGGQSKWMDTGQ